MGPAFSEYWLSALQILTEGSAPSVFGRNLEYSTEQVVLFWQPPSCFSQWSPSSFVVDDVSYSCAEEFDGGEGSPFPGPPRRGAHYVFARPECAQAHWSRRA